MMGFLNKFMDATGVALEERILSDVGRLLSATGWQPGKHGAGKGTSGGALPPVDGLRTYVRVMRMAPSAIRQEAGWTKGVPSAWPEAGRYLEERTGHAFPVLSKLTHKRAVRSLTAVLRDNLDADASVCGLAGRAPQRRHHGVRGGVRGAEGGRRDVRFSAGSA